MTLRFTKATPEAGHDGACFKPDNPRVLVTPDKFPKPLYPEDDGFYVEFERVMDEVTAARGKYNYSSKISSAFKRLGIHRADQLAELVHFDLPSDLMREASRAIKNKVWRKWTGVTSNFTDRIVLLDRLLGEVGHWASPSSFCAKWHFMVPRPEEVAGAIARGELDAPDHIKGKLEGMMNAAGYTMKDLAADQRIFTMYKEGCPPHPSYVAMHKVASAAGGAAIKALLILPEKERNMVDFSARNVGNGRANAGVHYFQDMRAAGWLGQEIVNLKLPEWMASTIGADPAEVSAALAENQVDWLAG